jgi:hypothetical protein
MEQPPSFIHNDSSLVCHLKKSLYGLKQAPCAWYAKMDSFLLATGFSRCHSDNTVYTKRVDGQLIILVLYVDDLILTSSDPKLINHVKSSIKNKFDMTDLGYLHYFLRLQVLQSKEGISLSQSKYAYDLLRHFHMEDCKPTPSPFQLDSSCLSHVLPLKWMPLYIDNLLVALCILPIPVLIFPLLLVLLLGICNTLMKAIGKQPK